MQLEKFRDYKSHAKVEAGREEEEEERYRLYHSVSPLYTETTPSTILSTIDLLYRLAYEILACERPNA